MQFHRTKELLVVEILLCVSIAQNMLFWYFNYFPSLLYDLELFMICGISLIKSKSWWNENYLKPAILLITLASCITIQTLMFDGIVVGVDQGLPYVVGTMLYLLKDKYKYELLRFTTKIFGLILLISLTAYLVVLLFSIPPLSILDRPFGYDDHFNYFFFILPVKFAIPRFSGPFIEPGHMSVFCVFVLYANRFYFKKNKLLIVYLLCVIASFSLAGYLLLILSYFIHIHFKLKELIPTIVITSMIVGVISITVSEDENPITVLILSRLAYDEDKGIAGNNRTHGATDSYLKSLTSSGDILTGVGPKKYGELSENNILSGAGYKIFIIQYGFLGLLVVFLYYSICALYTTASSYSLGFLLIILVCCTQRTYPSWIAWLLPYICSFCNWINYTRNYNSTSYKSKLI